MNPFMSWNVSNAFMAGVFHLEHYHCVSGHFVDNAFINDVTKKDQTISYYDRYAHFQYQKAEKAIWNIQDMARTMLLHSNAR